MPLKLFSKIEFPILRILDRKGVNISEQLAAVDWGEIEETMAQRFPEGKREKMEDFARSVVNETMKRLETVLGDETDSENYRDFFNPNKSKIFQQLMPNGSKKKTIDSFVQVFTKVVTSLLPPNSADAVVVSSDNSIEEKDLNEPPPLNVECPPLGSPVIVSGILVSYKPEKKPFCRFFAFLIIIFYNKLKGNVTVT